MFVEAVKIILQEGDVSRLWRFRNDQGTHRNICVILANVEEQLLLLGGLRWTLGGSKLLTIKSALVQFTDSGGHSWIIERSSEVYRFFRNRQLIDGHAETRLREIFRDFMPGTDPSVVAFADIVREYDLTFEESHLQARLRILGGHRKSLVEQQGEARLEELKQVLHTLLGFNEMPSKMQLEHLLQQGDPIVRRQMGLEEQALEVKAATTHLSQIETGLSTRLEQEIAIIERIRLMTEPLIDPARSPKVLRERLNELETELKALQEDFALKNFPQPSEGFDWSQLLQALTRFLACDRLEKFARKNLQDARGQIKPVYDEYRASIVKFLQVDRDLIRELEQCLSELGDQVKRAESDDGKSRDGIAGKLNKLLGWQTKEGENLGPPAAVGSEHLEQSRAAVNLCLNHLGKLYLDLERHADLHEDKLGQLDDRYEKVVIEYGNAKEQWLTLSEAAGLPADLSVRSLVNYINSYSKISLIQQRRGKTQEDLTEFRNQVMNLGQLLGEWRTFTGSQKSVRLDNSNLTLSEARGVLQYAAKKRDQLQRMRTIESKQEAFKQLRDRLDQDMGQQSARWRKLLQHLGLAARPMPTQDWGRFVAAGIESLALDRLLNSRSKVLKDEHIFSAETLDFPLSLYVWKLGSHGNKARIALLQQLELADVCGLGLILTDDVASVEMLQKLGVSLGEKVLAKSGQVATGASKPSKTVISEKARAALEVFSTKAGDGSRENY